MICEKVIREIVPLFFCYIFGLFEDFSYLCIMLNKDITPHNKDGKAHEPWVVYYIDGKIWFKANYLNGKCNGYWEEYYPQ